MGVIKFTAVDRGELPSWLAAGASYHIANKFQGFPRRLVAKRERDETLDGTPESYLHALQREYSITTDFIPLHERPVWRAFLTSVLNAETFQLDLDAQQLLGNAGFESGNTNGWTAHTGSLAVNTDAGYQALGRYSGRYTIAINANSTAISQLQGSTSGSFPAVPGQVALLQALARRDETGLPNRNLNLAPAFYDGGGGVLSSTTVGTALSATSGFQLVSGTNTAPANTAGVVLAWFRAAPLNTDETGRWLLDEHLLALLSSWLNVYLVDEAIEEQQIGGVGVQYRFRVKTVP